MYHIKTDKRSIKSAQLICDGLAEVLKKNTKKYIDITISDVCSVCGIARTTFYRLFDMLDDVLLYQFDLLFKNSLEEFKYSEDNYAKIVLRIAIKDKSLIHALVDSGRTDLFDFTVRQRESDIINRMQLNINGRGLLYCTPVLNSIMYAVIKTWLSQGSKESADELYIIIKKTLRFIYKYA